VRTDGVRPKENALVPHNRMAPAVTPWHVTPLTNSRQSTFNRFASRFGNHRRLGSVPITRETLCCKTEIAPRILLRASDSQMNVLF